MSIWSAIITPKAETIELILFQRDDKITRDMHKCAQGLKISALNGVDVDASYDDYGDDSSALKLIFYPRD